jgi:AcrR family transcriptional regulator
VDRRTDTREAIRSVALELFSERGYDRASLRELADRLRITKAAVYHHFATKEDILASLAEEFAVPLDQVLAWGRDQPAGPATRHELLRRYADLLVGRHGRLVRFLEDDRAGLRELAPARRLLGRLDELSALLRDGGPAPEATLRARLCLVALHDGAAMSAAMSAAPGGTRAAPAEEAHRREAALAVAQDLVGPMGS